MYKARSACAALLAATSSVAFAQDDTAAQRADARLARLQRERPEPRRFKFNLLAEEAPKPPFALVLTLPVTYNTNIDTSDTDHRQDLHTDPSAELDYDQRTGTVRLFARVIADADNYFEHEDADASMLVGKVGVKMFDEKLGNFIPYAHYSGALLFGRNFQDHQVTLHTFTVGVNGQIPVGKLVLVPDFQLSRRFASDSGAERSQVGAGLELDGDFIPDRLSWSIGETVQFRHYTGGTNQGRHDVNFQTAAGLSYALTSTVTIELDFNFERNSSNRAGKDYSVFDFGPAIGIKVPFGPTRKLLK